MSDDDCGIVTHVWDANNTWMFKSMSPKFGHEKFMGQLPGTVTEMNKPEYSSVGPGYYRPKYARENEIPNPGMKPTLTTTNNKICAIRDNGIHRMDYRTGFELGRIGETLKNPMLSPCGYEPDEKINIAYIAFPDRDSVMDQTDVRFKPTPVADEDVQINLEMETGALMRESPALSMDRAGWTMQGCPLETQSRGLLPKTPAPHCRRSASCPPNPDQYLKKGEGMTLTQGITLCRAQRHAKQRFHDEFYNTRRMPGDPVSPKSPPKYPHIPTKREAKTMEWMRSETMRMSATCPQILNRTRCPRYKREGPLHAGCSKHELNETLSKTTALNKDHTMASDLQNAGNTTKCSFESAVVRDLESVRPLMPHLTEMSRLCYDQIGPGLYNPQDPGKDCWNPKFASTKNKGFGAGHRGLLHDAPPKPESFIAGKKRHRNLALSMFSTGYLRKSHRSPTVPKATHLLA